MRLALGWPAVGYGVVPAGRIFDWHPFGTRGYDPVPDIRAEHHPFAPWRYGRWRRCSQCGPVP